MCYDHFAKVPPPPRKSKEEKKCEHKYGFIEKLENEYVFFCEKCLEIKSK